MKTKSILLGLGLLAASVPLYGQTVIDITGATAFRSAALLAIKAGYDASGDPYQYSHDQAAGVFTTGSPPTPGATRSIFKGNFGSGASKITNCVIRTSFNGSVEGIRALVDQPASNPTYYQNVAGNFVTAAAVGGGETHNSTVGFAKSTESAASEFAFSDVSKNATPYGSFALQPSNASVGVVVFTMLANEGSKVTNVTSQQFRALMTAGFQPLSLFTGVAADDPNAASPSADARYVFATGRNDGSGTRTTYLAETGFGITNPVQQYLATASSASALTTIRLVPAANGANASTVWGQDIAGNGGYSSGSTLRTDMGKTGASVTVLDDTDGDIFGAPITADLVTWLSLNDAVVARGNGAVFCAYNGVKLNDIAASGSAMSAADKAKVTHGAYTAWGYQQLYRRADITSGAEVTVYNTLKTSIQTNLSSAGIPIADMAVSRSSDGGTVAP